MDDIKRMYRVAAVLELFGEDDDAKIVRDAADELQNRRAAIVCERNRADRLEVALRLVIENTDSHTGHMDEVLAMAESALAATDKDKGETG